MAVVLRLRAAVAAGILAGLQPAAAGAESVVQRGLSAPSPALGRALRYDLYKPAVAPARGERWPVLYLLHGGNPGESDWVDTGGLASSMDRAIAAGEMPPTVVVMPYAGDSWYVDNPDPGGAGLMKTALTRDLVRAVDASLPTAACRQARAVAGLSTGGYGALLFAFDQPREYGAAVSFSGSISPLMGPQMKARLKRAQRLYDGAFGVPFKSARFNAWNLFPKASRLGYGGAPRPTVFLSAGDRDLGGAIQGATDLHLALLRNGADSTLRIVGGKHDWALWRKELGPALAWLGPRLDPSCGAAMAAAPKADDALNAAKQSVSVSGPAPANPAAEP
ncbi:alpha/beta hydrolase-fold protein [Methylopila sp. M107]|uniref:alpha/beta hydrolase n=1 Tax=Methylopila sp. M107 TaxID=1101190 RepID=UPI00035D7A14|nr:alpha/beta hydrolase-fold protein [Methylopila sp. M107]